MGDEIERVPYCRSFAQKCAPAVASKTRSKERSCSATPTYPVLLQARDDAASALNTFSKPSLWGD
jgi:hypothetical protein